MKDLRTEMKNLSTVVRERSRDKEKHIKVPELKVAELPEKEKFMSLWYELNRGKTTVAAEIEAMERKLVWRAKRN